MIYYVLIYVLNGHLCFRYKKSKMAFAPSEWYHSPCECMLSTVLLMTWRERQERHVDDTQGEQHWERREYNRWQNPDSEVFRTIRSSPTSFQYKLLYPSSKIQLHGQPRGNQLDGLHSLNENFFLDKSWIYFVPCSHAVLGETFSVLGMELERILPKLRMPRWEFLRLWAIWKLWPIRPISPDREKGGKVDARWLCLCLKYWCLEQEVGLLWPNSIVCGHGLNCVPPLSPTSPQRY